MIILFFLFSFLLEVLYLLLSPILFAVLRKAPGSERLAIDYPDKTYDIMVHAASVGETNGIKQLLLELLEVHPNITILLTTNTKNGRHNAEELHPRLDVMISPLDIFHLRIKQIRQSKPRLIMIAETEIWTQLLLAAKLRKVPVVFVNARISKGTFRKYSAIKTITRWLGSNIKAIYAQSEYDCERFNHLFQTECSSLGNLKFSVQQPHFDSKQLREQWGYSPEDKIIVFGSSRPGEENLILGCFANLKREFPKLKLIIALRHPERMKELMNLFSSYNASYFSKKQSAHDIHVIDEMGHLLPAYALCDIAIIGGSFYSFGGHNPLEAAYYSKVIVMGRYHISCLSSVMKLHIAKAIILSSADTLTGDLRYILLNPVQFNDYGIRAKQVLSENSQSLSQTLELINKFL